MLREKKKHLIFGGNGGGHGPVVSSLAQVQNCTSEYSSSERGLTRQGCEHFEENNVSMLYLISSWKWYKQISNRSKIPACIGLQIAQTGSCLDLGNDFSLSESFSA